MSSFEGNISTLRLPEEEVRSLKSVMELDLRGLGPVLVGGEEGEEGMSMPTTRAPEENGVGVGGPPGGEVWVWW